MNGIHLAQDTDQRQVLVNVVIDFQVPHRVEGFFTTVTIITFLSKNLPHQLTE